MNPAQLEAALLEIYGIGPSRVKLIAKKVRELNPQVTFRTLRETLKQVPGLSTLTISDLTYNPVKVIPRNIISKIEQEYSVLIAGSYRRELPCSHDIDVITDKPREYWTKFPNITPPVMWGEKKMMCYVLVEGRYYKIDFYFVTDENRGALLMHLTGSATFNVFMRVRAQKMGMKLSEEGLFRNDKKIAYKTEEDIFTALDMPYIPPKLRTGWIHTSQLDSIQRNLRRRPHRN